MVFLIKKSGLLSSKYEVPSRSGDVEDPQNVHNSVSQGKQLPKERLLPSTQGRLRCDGKWTGSLAQREPSILLTSSTLFPCDLDPTRLPGSSPEQFNLKFSSRSSVLGPRLGRAFRMPPGILIEKLSFSVIFCLTLLCLSTIPRRT